MKQSVLIGLVIFSFLNSCTQKRQDFGDNEKALLSFKELRKMENPESIPSYINLNLNLDSINTYTLLDTYIENICKGTYPSVQFDKCWEVLPVIFNLENLSFKPNKNNYYNVSIPAIGFQCNHGCNVDFIHMKRYGVFLNKNNKIEIEDYPKKDTLTICNSREFESIVNDVFRTHFNQFFQMSLLINNIQKRDSLLEYCQMLCEPINMSLSMDTSLTFKNLEPIFATIVSSYTENMKIYVNRYMHKKVKDLNISDIRILGYNIELRIQIHRPFNNVKFVAPVVIDSLITK